jgi:hypothetical protein
MIRLVASAFAIYVGALVSASSYLSASSLLMVEHGARTTMAAAPHDEKAQARRAYEALPVAFVPNAGQLDPRVHYHARGDRYAFYLMRDGVTLAFLDRAPGAVTSGTPGDRGGHALVLRFAGANPRVEPQGEARLAGDVNYFQGSNAAEWRSGVGRYARIVYRDLWPGIDARLFEQGGVLKYEFLVHPGARPEAIRLAYAGAAGVTLDGDGSLRIETSMGTLQDAAPVSYQTIGGTRVPVDSRYDLETAAPAAASATPSKSTPAAERRFGFVIGHYQRDVDLVIDPGVRYATFLGGTSHETAASIQIDAAGNAIIAGTTQSPNFPTTAGAFRRTGAASNFSDVFVTKLNAAGTGARLFDVPGRRQLRLRPADRDRCGGECLHHGPDQVVGLSHHGRRLRSHVQHRQLSAMRDRSIRHVRHQAECGGKRPGLLDVPRGHRHR